MHTVSNHLCHSNELLLFSFFHAFEGSGKMIPSFWWSGRTTSPPSLRLCLLNFAIAWRVLIQMLVNRIVVRTNAIRFSSISSVPNLDFHGTLSDCKPCGRKIRGWWQKGLESVLCFIHQETKQEQSNDIQPCALPKPNRVAVFSALLMCSSSIFFCLPFLPKALRFSKPERKLKIPHCWERADSVFLQGI